MKKIFTFLLAAIILFSFRTLAQTGTTCNASFNFSFLNLNTLKFTPSTIGDSPLVHHDWSFGDASPVNHGISPTHSFSTPGTYTIKHYLSRYNPNGVLICAETVTKQVVIEHACTLTANFNWSIVAGNLLTVAFQNTSTSMSNTDSVKWTFGDGTSSLEVNPKHIYANPGSYKVCLRVKKKSNAPGSEPCVREFCKTITINHPCNLLANFNWSPVVANPLSFVFQNLSTPLAATDSVRWTFGDGTSSLDISPKHTYANPGTYKVCLRVKKNENTTGSEPCVREFCSTIIIKQPCDLQANFNLSPVVANPLSFVFQNLSTPSAATDSVRWTFGDGTSSLEVNPKHIYANPGSYKVCLRVKKNGNAYGSEPCVREFCKTIIINHPCNLQANFNWSPVVANPLSFVFQNLSTPLVATDSVRWTFGDGTSSLEVNPKHIYANPGTYKVCLRIKKNGNTAGSEPCVREFCNTIIIKQPCDLQANFNMSPVVANPLSFVFQNLSTPLATTDSIRWTFGDGTSSLEVNPKHVYANPGTYKVCLRIKKNGITAGSEPCVREFCKTIVINHPCDLKTNFNWSPVVANPLSFEFKNLSTPLSNTDSVRWTFGDGTTSLDHNVKHVYSHAGTYTVCLRVKKNSNAAGTTACVGEICKVITIPSPTNCETVKLSFDYKKDPIAPNKIYFSAISNISLSDQFWTIAKLYNSNQPTINLHQKNPDFVFHDTGHYRVCLKAIALNGCVKEYCNIVKIERLVESCELQVFPNPAHNQANVSVLLIQPELIKTYVYNGMNILVKEQKQQGIFGNNTITININDWLPGVYTIKLIYGNRTCHARFTKL